jgi:hypothetical protein
VTAWWVASVVLLVAVTGVGIACARSREPARGLLWLQLSGVLGTMLLVVLATALERSITFAVAVVFAAMSTVGVVAFVRLGGVRP